MNILVTGFKPFDKEVVNPSERILELLPDHIGPCAVTKLILPTEFNKSLDLLEETLLALRPEIVLSLGQAGGRSHISLERVAINIRDARIEDNGGFQPRDELIMPEGAVGYFTTLPIKKILHQVLEKNIPVAISNTAGTYVCNNLMYGLLYFNEKYAMNMKAGFIHLPYLPDQVLHRVNVASMNEKLMLKAVEIALICSMEQGMEEHA